MLNRTFISLLIVTSLVARVMAQDAGENEVFVSPSFHYYGYDFSKIKIADDKRQGQSFSKFFPALNTLLLKKFNQKEFDPFPTQNGLFTMDNDSIVMKKARGRFSPDVLASLISAYKLDQTSGIGCIMVFECFNSDAMTVTADLVFFDISSRKALYVKEIS